MRPGHALAFVAASLTGAMVLVTVALSGEAALWKLALLAVAFGLPGALCAVLQPHNAVGWLLLVVALAFSSLALATQWVAAGHDSAWAVWWTDRAGAVVVPLTLATLLLLPDGRLPSPRWRSVTAAALTLQIGVVAAWSLVEAAPLGPGAPNPIGVLPASWAGPVDTAGDWLLPLPLLLVLAAVAIRVRRPDDRARLAGTLWGVAAFVALATAGHALWPAAAHLTDVLGAALLAAGLLQTLLRRDSSVEAPQHEPLMRPTPELSAPELSVREREVLVLVAEGLTNREVAARLSISPVTARNHVSNILTKLGLENRTQAAMWLSRSSEQPS